MGTYPIGPVSSISAARRDSVQPKCTETSGSNSLDDMGLGVDPFAPVATANTAPRSSHTRASVRCSNSRVEGTTHRPHCRNCFPHHARWLPLPTALLQRTSRSWGQGETHGRVLFKVDEGTLEESRRFAVDAVHYVGSIDGDEYDGAGLDTTTFGLDMRRRAE